MRDRHWHIAVLLLTLTLVIGCNPGQSVKKARERALRDNLFQMRALIEQYTMDKDKAPQSLDDLVRAGYLKSIPKDITGSSETWVAVQNESSPSSKETQTGIVDVHSGSTEVSSDGTPYNRW